MRTVITSLFFVVACATANRGINVHTVRTEIKDEIAAHPGDAGPRTIISMGKVTNDSAVVFTEHPGAPRQEETWVRGPHGWALSESHAAIVQRE